MKTEEKILNETNEMYSGESSGALLANSCGAFELDFSGVLASFGLLFGPMFWLFFKICPLDTRKKFLEEISRFRNATKAVQITDKNAVMAGLPINGWVGILTGSAISLMMGALIAKYIEPKIKALEQGIQLRTRLNQLLLVHIERNIYNEPLEIPKNLSESELVYWLENPNNPEWKKKNIIFGLIEANDFKDYSQEEANTLKNLRTLSEIITGIYTVNVANTDLGLSKLAAFLYPNYLNLALNLAMGSLMALAYQRIAKYHVDSILLPAKKCFLTGKIAVKNLKLAGLTQKIEQASKEEALLADDCKSNSAINQLRTQCEEIKSEIKPVTTELHHCRNQLASHHKKNLENVLLFTAGLRGFQEGGMAASLVTFPVPLLISLHVISATFLPLYIAVLSLTIFLGAYCAYHRYQAKKQELDAKKTITKPAKQLAARLAEKQVPQKRGQQYEFFIQEKKNTDKNSEVTCLHYFR